MVHVLNVHLATALNVALCTDEDLRRVAQGCPHLHDLDAMRRVLLGLSVLGGLRLLLLLLRDLLIRRPTLPVRGDDVCGLPTLIRTRQSALCNPQSASAIRTLQSAMRNAQSALHNPQSTIHDPRTAIAESAQTRILHPWPLLQCDACAG